MSLQFKRSICCNLVTSSMNSFRENPAGSIEDIATVNSYGETDTLTSLLALCNSSTAAKILKYVVPTMNNTPGDVGKLPVAVEDMMGSVSINRLSSENTGISRADWDSFEVSYIRNRYGRLERQVAELGGCESKRYGS